MATLRAVVRVELVGLLMALLGLVVWAAARGRLRLDGMLAVRDSAARRRMSVARVQLLLTTLLFAVAYLLTTVILRKPDALPAPPAFVVALVALSQAIALVAGSGRRAS
jgi:hypothetical protein